MSNCPTEAVNLLIERIKRAGFGFRNVANYRPAPAAALRGQLAHSSNDADPRPVTIDLLAIGNRVLREARECQWQTATG